MIRRSFAFLEKAQTAKKALESVIDEIALMRKRTAAAVVEANPEGTLRASRSHEHRWHDRRLDSRSVVLRLDHGGCVRIEARPGVTISSAVAEN